jgi:MarR family transcriptional regulator, organic hydroperoxide resistance regulator
MTEKFDAREIENIYRLHLMLRQTDDMNHKCREDELKKYNITPEQASVLICIQALGKEATPANTSRWLNREPHSILIILRRMQNMGLIEMEPHKKNKHMFFISLTKTGQEAYLNSIKFRSILDVFSTIPKEERRYLFYILKKIRDESFKLLKLDLRNCDKLSEAFQLPISEAPKRKSATKRIEKVEI